MIVAAVSGQVEVARRLLAAGANKTKTVEGKTALQLAKTAEMKRLLR